MEGSLYLSLPFSPRIPLLVEGSFGKKLPTVSRKLNANRDDFARAVTETARSGGLSRIPPRPRIAEKSAGPADSP
jgi:hypothetical protein